MDNVVRLGQVSPSRPFGRRFLPLSGAPRLSLGNQAQPGLG